MVPFENASLAEKQMYYYNGTHCIYCCGETDLVDSIEVYQQSHGLIYICRKCQAWVGVHGGSSDQSMGTVAKKTLRDLRHQAHLLFDPLWMKKRAQGHSVKSARGKAYAWVSELLGIHRDESHIGYFNEEQCKLLIAECKKFYKTPEKIEEEKRVRETRVRILKAQVNHFGLEANEFALNGIHKFEITHPETKKVFVYDVVTNKGAWATVKKMKWRPIDDLLAFIEETFKKSPPKQKRVASKSVDHKDNE